MRVARLELKNFRTFKHLVLTDIPAFVVLVSPNGCGKSSVLEAIAAAHDLVHPYHRDNYEFSEAWQSRTTHVWPPHLPFPVRAGEHKAEIEVEIEATDSEKEYLAAANIKGTRGKVHIVIEDRNKVTAVNSEEVIRKLFLYHTPADGVGFIDYVRPVRFYLHKALGNFASDMSDARTRQVLMELHQTYDHHAKFNSFKSFVVSAQLSDLSNLQTTGARRDSLEVFRQIFDVFFAPKKFIGYKASPGGEARVVVDSPCGELDTDFLSDGEKEILHIFGHHFRFRDLHNVVLWDTPELHLNSALEARLYPALLQVAPHNQWWIATHSLEFIESVPLENIYFIKNTPDGAVLEKASGDERKARLAIYRQLGARVGLCLVSSLVVFAEGKEAHSDKRILERLVGESLPAVSFVAGGSVETVLSVGSKANALLQEASAKGDFLAVVDRDYRNEREVEQTVKKYSGRVFMWNAHEIENLFLDESIMFKTLEVHDALGSSKGVAEVKQELVEAVRKIKGWIAADWVAWDIEKATRCPPRRITLDDPSKSLSDYVRCVKQQIEGLLPGDKLAGLIDSKTREIDDLIDSGGWRDRLPGKQILKIFLDGRRGIDQSDFINTAVSVILREHLEVPEIERLRREIQSRIGTP